MMGLGTIEIIVLLGIAAGVGGLILYFMFDHSGRSRDE